MRVVIFSVVFFFFIAGCCDDRDDNDDKSSDEQDTEYLTVVCNIPDCRYALYECSEDSPIRLGPTVAGEGDQDNSFILPARTERETCYKVYCKDVEGFVTPDPIVVKLVAGVPQDAYCEYVAK